MTSEVESSTYRKDGNSETVYKTRWLNSQDSGSQILRVMVPSSNLYEASYCATHKHAPTRVNKPKETRLDVGVVTYRPAIVVQRDHLGSYGYYGNRKSCYLMFLITMVTERVVTKCY